jgi:hypothetical protein
MRKASVLVSVLVFATATVANQALAASSPKPGAKCAKLGQTQVVGNKKFTCTKSGSKFTWNRGVTVQVKATPSAAASTEPTAAPVEASPSASASPNPVQTLIKFKNCTEAKAAGATPLTKVKTPELYELNAGLDRDKDGIACES